MNLIKSFFCSFKIILPLVAVYAISCAVATFIENDYGTRMAKLVIYQTWWFNALHVYLLIALVATLLFSKYWKQKKYASIILHVSFIFIIIGAGITRFSSFEGLMHIREGESSDTIIASDPTLNIVAINEDGKQEAHFLDIPLQMGYKKNIKVQIFEKTLELDSFNISKLSPDKKDDSIAVSLRAAYNGFTQSFHFAGGEKMDLKFDKGNFADVKIFIGWGKRQINLPFSIKLNKFDLERYPGSMSPSSYASEVEIFNNEGQAVMSYRIFMNNVLDYKGYRFYQSSYDQDEKGTILSVNKDPGKNTTYLGYLLLILGAIWVLFSKNGRFRYLARFLQEQKIAIFCLCLIATFWSKPLYAQEKQLTPEQMAEFVTQFKQNTTESIKAFSKIQLQNYSGRIEPVDTIAINTIHKITKKDTFLGLSPNQMFLGMMLYPNIWKDLKIIAINDNEIKRILGLKKTDTHASFSDFFNGTLGYKLHNYVEEANQTNPARRNTFEKDLLKVDERVNLTYSIFSGSFLKIFPLPETQKWLDPINIFQQTSQENAHHISQLLRNFFESFDKGVVDNQWQDANQAIEDIIAYQKEYGKELYLPEHKIEAEIFLNHSNFFSKLIAPYILLGLVLFILVLICIIRNKSLNRWLNYTIYTLMLLCVLLHTSGLLLRWYVSDHSPWSNAYESMLYIAWASAIAGIVFFRKYNLALSSSMFLAGISLFVANLGFMDPQITPLVPVLKSYWLNIHVSIITASYGFLGLCFILGSITLVLLICKKFIAKNHQQLSKSIASLYALNEMSMLLGLLMLTVGNFLGGVWANESWGRYWSWDPKETWALISIGVYGIILHLRFLKLKNMDYVFSLASVIGFYSILMTYFGVNYYLSGMHSYAAGDPIPVPIFVYVFVALTIIIGALAFPKKSNN